MASRLFKILLNMLIFVTYRIHVSSFSARKARDSIIKTIYSRLFEVIISSVNQSSHSESELSTYIIDIAGFGKNTFINRLIYIIQDLCNYFTECFDINRYEQFCINYINEKLHSFCSQQLIHSEQEWYRMEGLKLPLIPFPGNDDILGN